MPSKEDKAKAFSSDIQARALPIEVEDAYDFAKAILKQKPPHDWLKRVTNGLQFINQDLFNADLSAMAKMATIFLIDRPYAVTFNSQEKSDYWIYQQLIERGMPSTAEQYNDHTSDIFDLETEREWASIRDSGLPARELRLLLRKVKSGIVRWVDSLPPDHLICAFDDFSLSGLAFEELLMPSQKHSETSRFHGFALYATRSAKKRLKNNNISMHRVRRNVYPLGRTMDKADVDFLTNTMRELGDDAADFKSNILFWTWYKIPDNMPTIFTGRGYPPLIRKEKFQPPYRQTQSK